MLQLRPQVLQQGTFAGEQPSDLGHGGKAGLGVPCCDCAHRLHNRLHQLGEHLCLGHMLQLRPQASQQATSAWWDLCLCPMHAGAICQGHMLLIGVTGRCIMLSNMCRVCWPGCLYGHKYVMCFGQIAIRDTRCVCANLHPCSEQLQRMWFLACV